MQSIRTDYHIHPNYSIDAAPAKIMDYCRRALELGLAEICFTTHFEFDPERREIDHFVINRGRRQSVHDLAWLEDYIKEIQAAQKEFEVAGLKVKAGVEVGFEPGQEKYIERVTTEYPFDFVLGAIHCLDHVAISSLKESPRYFSRCNLQDVRRDYFSTLRQAVESDLFDCIAHVDLYRRYGIKHYGAGILTIHHGVIESIFEEMARRGVGLEVNTSSRRRGLKEMHPTREILSLAAKAGVKIYTVGSDAHSPADLGDGIDEALALLEEFHLSNHVFTRRRAVPCFSPSKLKYSVGKYTGNPET